MRNLIDFVARFHAFFIFLLLETVAFAMIIRFHNYQNASFFNSANYLSGNFYTAVSDVRGYLLLKKTNTLLAEENAMLRMYSYVPDSIPPFYKEDICFDSLPYIIKYIPAKVINNTTNKPNNFITLNKGSNHGIKKQMGVITQTGIAGIVADVSPNFATVMSVLHKKSNISIRLKKANFIGSLNWHGADAYTAKISGVPVNALIENGDTVMTSGFSSIFPKDIPIGKVIKVANTTAGNFYDIEVQLFTDFYTLNYVYVVQNALKDEQDQLEANHERLSE